MAASTPGASPRTWVYRVSTGESAPFQNLIYPYFGVSLWSPESDAIATGRENAVIRVDMTGAQNEVLRENISAFAWGPSGSYFFGIAAKGLFWAGRGAGRKQVTVQKSGEGITASLNCCPMAKPSFSKSARPRPWRRGLPAWTGANRNCS